MNKKEVKQVKESILLPDGMEIIYNDINPSFILTEKKQVESIQKELLLNDHCYFCDFSELTPHKHHIIRTSDGGEDTNSNKIPLCPNHHELIHKRKYYLIFSKGLYFLKELNGIKVIPPSDRQKTYLRELPFSSIINNSYLSVEGDLKSKAEIRIIDFHKSRREKCRKIALNNFKSKKNG